MPLPVFSALKHDRRGSILAKACGRGELRRWLDDDDAVLAFGFPEGLEPAEEQVLRSDLKRLRRWPWSPQAGLDAVLADWPKDQPTLDFTLEAAEVPLIRSSEALLAEAREQGLLDAE